MSSHKSHPSTLRDFTTTSRVISVSVLAVGIGGVSTIIAWALLRLIGFFTNILYFGKVSGQLVSPAGNHLGWFAVLIPVAGGLVIGLMARYGSERIRGHGIPEALESILINGSKVQPRLAVLKPISAAISIGSGGPFGAEGPIIMTGGAIGSVISQLFRLSAAERKTLLVAGAAAGMSATFATPVAAVLLAVELLLFEWKPRSLIPVALASATAAAARHYVLGAGPLFPVPQHVAFIGPQGLAGCVIAGLLAGALSTLLTIGVYAAEDGFGKLPVHWMWWPALGGVIVGLGGMIFPQALGVGYDTIRVLLQGDVPRTLITGVLLVKSVIWVISLGSGTSGGVLAPLLMMGAALGGVEAAFLPYGGAGFWPLISMGAILGGTLGAPFTAILFALELTHDMNVLLPLLLAATLAHLVTALVLKRSILTEKIARRGLHLTREYGVDPLDVLLVREVMRTGCIAFTEDAKVADIERAVHNQRDGTGQFLYPVVDRHQKIKGVITRKQIRELAAASAGDELISGFEHDAVVAAADEPLRTVVSRMTATGRTRLPVVDGHSQQLVGMLSLRDLLRAWARITREEQDREQVLRFGLRLYHRTPRSFSKASRDSSH
jgi:CIC family chloride channel protein